MSGIYTSIAEAHGIAITLIGIGTVFAVLAAVWIFTEVFSRIFDRTRAGYSTRDEEKDAVPETTGQAASARITIEGEGTASDPVEAHVAAMAVALEMLKEKRSSARRTGPAASEWKIQGRISLMNNLPR